MGCNEFKEIKEFREIRQINYHNLSPAINDITPKGCL